MELVAPPLGRGSARMPTCVEIPLLVQEAQEEVTPVLQAAGCIAI